MQLGIASEPLMADGPPPDFLLHICLTLYQGGYHFFEAPELPYCNGNAPGQGDILQAPSLN